MYARAYYPGRSGQIMLVPREGDFVTLNEPASLFMHGSPWSYDANIPLLFFGPPFIRRGTYADAVVQQDIVPTLAKFLRLPLPPTVAGRSLEKALDSSAGRPRAIFGGSAGRYEAGLFRAASGRFADSDPLASRRSLV